MKKTRRFFTEIYLDERIPKRDKWVFIALLATMGLRVLFIPDWIPYLGKLDVLLLLGLLGDYCSNVLDQNILLSHYPWRMKSFARVRRFGQFLAFFAPKFIGDHLWLYVKEPF